MINIHIYIYIYIYYIIYAWCMYNVFMEEEWAKETKLIQSPTTNQDEHNCFLIRFWSHPQRSLGASLLAHALGLAGYPVRFEHFYPNAVPLIKPTSLPNYTAYLTLICNATLKSWGTPIIFSFEALGYSLKSFSLRLFAFYIIDLIATRLNLGHFLRS